MTPFYMKPFFSLHGKLVLLYYNHGIRIPCALRAVRFVLHTWEEWRYEQWIKKQ